MKRKLNEVMEYTRHRKVSNGMQYSALDELGGSVEGRGQPSTSTVPPWMAIVPAWSG